MNNLKAIRSNQLSGFVKKIDLIGKMLISIEDEEENNIDNNMNMWIGTIFRLA